MIRARFKTDANLTFLLLQLQNNPLDGVLSTLRVAGGAAAKTFPLAKAAAVEGNKVVFTVSLKDLKGAGEPAKPVLNKVGATTSGDAAGALFVPTIDELVSDLSYKVCG